MKLAAAWNLLWFVGVGGVIMLLYMLRLRRRRYEVASVLLWSQLLQDFQANSPWQRLRRHWLLIVQLMAALVLALAMAQPYTRAWGYAGQAHVLVLDGSASMLANDLSPNRFERARSLAQQYVQNMPSGDQAAIVVAAARPRVLCGLTSNRSELLRALREAQAAETATNLAEALSLAAAMLTSFGAPTIEVFTDGGLPEPRDVDVGRAKVNYHLVGKSAANVGIVAIDLREEPNRRGDYNLFVLLRHNLPTTQRYAVEVWREERLVDVQEVELPPGSEAPVQFQLTAGTGRTEVLRIHVDSRDALTADNTAYAVMPPLRPLQILLVSRGNLFLETALQLYPHAQIHQTSTPPASCEGYDLVLYDQVAPPAPPQCDAVIINVVPPWFRVVPLSEARDTMVVDWQATHPVMRYVDLNVVRLGRAQPVLPREGVETLAETAEGAVVVSAQQGRHRWLLLAFDIMDSDLPLRVAFPVMILNALQWLVAEDTRVEGRLLPTGGVASIPVPSGMSQITLRLPDGRRVDLQAQEEKILFEQTTQVGLYRCEETGYLFAANLLQRQETDLPRYDLPLSSASSTNPHLHKVVVRREWWQWLALALLLLLAVEWLMYHRRW